MIRQVFSEDVACISRVVRTHRPKPKMTGDRIFKMQQVEEALAKSHRVLTFLFEDCTATTK